MLICRAAATSSRVQANRAGEPTGSCVHASRWSGTVSWIISVMARNASRPPGYVAQVDPAQLPEDAQIADYAA